MSSKRYNRSEPVVEYASKQVQVPVDAVEKPKLTFPMWAISKGVPSTNWAGMKAYTKLTLATQEEWDEAFKNY